jgi:hypothetical protein
MGMNVKQAIIKEAIESAIEDVMAVLETGTLYAEFVTRGNKNDALFNDARERGAEDEMLIYHRACRLIDAAGEYRHRQIRDCWDGVCSDRGAICAVMRDIEMADWGGGAEFIVEAYDRMAESLRYVQ